MSFAGCCKNAGVDLPRADAAVEGVLVAKAEGEGRFEERGGDFPARRLVGVGVAVGGDEGVEEFEKATGDAEGAEGVDQAALGDAGVEEVGDGIWNIVYYRTLLGKIDERSLHITGSK